MSSVNSPCAACKFLRRKCMQGCIFAPHFPPDNPARFAQVHRVFGASNVAKLLNDLTPAQREDAVNSLAYEAEARLHDPVYGCVGYISLLQHRLLQLQRDLSAAKKELSACIRATALGPFVPHSQFYGEAMAMQAGMGLAGQRTASASTAAPPMHRDQQQQLVEAQQLEMARLLGDGSGVGILAATPAESSAPLSLVSPHVGVFEGSFAVLQQQQGGLFSAEESGHRLLKRSLDDGRSGAGPSF